MNRDIYRVLDRMRKAKEGHARQYPNATQEDLTIDMGDLLTLLAEEAERWSKKGEEQAETVIGLTKALKIFTIVLVAVGIVQIALIAWPLLKGLFRLSM